MPTQLLSSKIRVLVYPAIALLLSTCGGSKSSGPTLINAPGWSPNVPGTGTSNHDSSVVVSKSTQTQTGRVTGLQQVAAQTFSFTIDLTQSLGPDGSVTLVAQTTSFSDPSLGSAFPYLVSLKDGSSKEYINLSSLCTTESFYSCGATTCTPNPDCKINSPSAYFNRLNWEEHQSQTDSADNSPSVNTFPTCNWTGGSTTDEKNPACAFGNGSFTAPLPTGTYTAQYVLVSDSQATVSNATATINLTVVKKTSSSTGGAVDLNVFLVGTNNINAGRVAKGQQNLNTLVSKVAEIYQQANVGVKIGAVNAIETTALNNNGDDFATLHIENIGDLLTTSGKLAPSGSEGKAINVFIVSSIVDSSQTQFTILGYDGGIGGPTLNGTTQSGLVVSSFDDLATFNPNCGGSDTVCPASTLGPDFMNLAGVIAHEMGHFFGLNHLSELDGATHDYIVDTPVCTATEGTNPATLTVNSCLNTDQNVFPATGKRCKSACPGYNSSNGQFCPTAIECEFNYIMWWTTRNFADGGIGDGLLFSPDSGTLIRYSSFVQ